MKTLYLVRHAKSSWDNAEELSDRERPLNKRGKRDAPKMAVLLAERNIIPDVLVSSPAVRAYTTAQVFAQVFDLKTKDIQLEEDIYEHGTSVEKILQIVQQLDDKHTSAMVFGHNPTFTELANCYSGTLIENVPTCGVVCIEFNVPTWKEVSEKNGKIAFFEYPKKLS